MNQPSPPPKDPLTDPGPWNAIAVGYDEEFAEKLPELLDEAMEILEPSPEDRVLDVATGPGQLVARIAPKVARVVAIDFAEKMIERLRSRLDANGIGNVEPMVMDGLALELEDASFDRAVSMFGWFLFSDRPKGLAEMFRVLRPGGRVLVTSWGPIERNSVLGAGLQAIREALPDLPRPPGPLPTQIPEVCAEELRAAGFRDVTTKVVTLDAPFESIDEYLRTFSRASAPFVVLRKKLGDAAFDAALERAKAWLAERYRDGLSLRAEAIYSSGTR